MLALRHTPVPGSTAWATACFQVVHVSKVVVM